MLNIAEASTLLGLSKATLYKYICQRTIPHYKIGSRVLFDEQKLQSWLEARTIEPFSVSLPRRRALKTKPLSD